MLTGSGYYKEFPEHLKDGCRALFSNLHKHNLWVSWRDWRAGWCTDTRAQQRAVMTTGLSFPAYLLQFLQEHLSDPGGSLKTGDHFLLPLGQAGAGSNGVGQAFQGEACRRRGALRTCPA